jgi:CDP-diacylglycerol--glycerol-3-phosphate 3-phosphatidyltransferase
MLLPNVITITRLVFLPFIIWCLSHQTVTYRIASFVLAALCFSTDWLDGYLARRLNQVSALGKMLDPVVDKVVVVAIVIALIVYRDLPLWAVIIFAGKDIGFIFIGLFMIRRMNIGIAANFWGKLNLWMLGGMSGLYIIDAPFKVVFLIAALITTIIALFSYGAIFLRIIKNRGID